VARTRKTASGRESLRIGELGRRLDLNPKTIRYYEQIGLLPPAERSDSGYRLFSRQDEERLRFIASARRVGFGLGEIKEVLALRERGQAPCRYVSETIERRRSEIDSQLADLRRLKGELDELSERARTRPPAGEQAGYCHILEAETGR